MRAGNEMPFIIITLFNSRIFFFKNRIYLLVVSVWWATSSYFSLIYRSDFHLFLESICDSCLFVLNGTSRSPSRQLLRTAFFSLCTGNTSVFLCIVLVVLKTGHFRKHVYLCSVAQSCLTLCNPMDYVARQASLSMGISRQEYWSGFPFPTSGDLPDPGIEPMSLNLLHLKVDSLPLSNLGSS